MKKANHNSDEDETRLECDLHGGVRGKYYESSRVLGHREAARRLAEMGGTQPELRPVPRRQSR